MELLGGDKNYGIAANSKVLREMIMCELRRRTKCQIHVREAVQEAINKWKIKYAVSLRRCLAGAAAAMARDAWNGVQEPFVY
ncbi:hypothetical protein E2C01_000126 [Portunus trituberculatus]|uniref:Uncharacterized protein n=1 Tax=Portunus trituberculatus TaxID=210409 RepID=A0A5B7CD90_PORTR|nr:hypothetical protein [Portunus trituberculatus]